MPLLENNIYGDWKVSGEYNVVGTKEVKLTKMKMRKRYERGTISIIPEQEQHIYIPREFLIKLGKWLEAHKIIEEEQK